MSGLRDTMMNMVGGEDRARRLWKEVRENQDRLRSCPRHDFQPDGPPQQLGVRYHCSACKGHIDAVCFAWYTKGIEHAAAAG